ncbi:MAG: hypothetical protein M1134_01575, partial [Actinobacteria bacterium]|nr:hypothetical protein [Actinomycetota bacterium]
CALPISATAVLLVAGVASAMPQLATQIGRDGGGYQLSNTAVHTGTPSLVTRSTSGGWKTNANALFPGAVLVDDVSVHNDGTASARDISVTVTGSGKLAGEIAVTIRACAPAAPAATTAAASNSCLTPTTPLLSPGPLGRRSVVSKKLQPGKSFAVMITATVLKGARQNESGALSISVGYS